MPHVLNHRGQYYRVEIAEIANPDEPNRAEFVSWASDAFADLKELPNHPCSRLVPGPPQPSYADALQQAFDWLASHRPTAQPPKRTAKSGSKASVIYTVWLFKDETSLGFDFEEFSDAKAFAAAAEKSIDVTKVGVKNNESPQYLTVWEKKPT